VEVVKNSLLTCFLLGIGATSVHGRIEQLSKTDRVVLEHPASLKMLSSMSQIPADVKSACATVMADHQFRLANPGRPFQATDVQTVVWPLPLRRLIWGAEVGDYFVIHYEYGGRGLSNHILLVQREPRSHQARVIWSATGKRFGSYDKFAKAIQADALDDSLSTAH
jgi:hypothetical protein